MVWGGGGVNIFLDGFFLGGGGINIFLDGYGENTGVKRLNCSFRSNFILPDFIRSLYVLIYV